MADLSQNDWTKQLKDNTDGVILDVRTQEEVDEGLIPFAIHIDILKGQGFLDELEMLDKNKTYFVYCRSGNRSGQACAIMKQLGFEHAYNLAGGMNEWTGDVVNK